MSWHWLAVGACLAPFVPAQTPLAWAAWLAPVFLVRFSRTTHPAVALPAIGAAMFLANRMAFRGGFMPGSGGDLYLVLAGIALAYVVVFAFDRALWRRFGSIVSTLVFPLASTVVGFLATVGNPLGTAGSEAYSQSERGLLQIVSITGIWGLVFLMAWFASVMNAWWEQGFSVRHARMPPPLFTAVFLAVVASGSVRLAFFAPAGETVRVAAMAPDRASTGQGTIIRLGTEQERTESRAQVAPLIDELFRRSEREARAGAEIIAWSEAAARILKEDEASFMARAQTLADEANIYLQVGLSTYRELAGSIQTENRAILLTPEGRVAWDYHKAKPTPGDADQPGPGLVPTIDTPHGKLATVICQDDLFPGLVSQAGRSGVDILLLPSNDWPAVAEWHSQVATFRAIENGVAIVRPTARGISSVTDHTGRTLAYRADYAGGDEQTLVAAVPTKGAATVYPYTRDAFAYLSVAGLAGLTGLALIRARAAYPPESA